MRVLEISLFHPELVRGGAQQAAYELFRGLRHAGIDATLLASADRTSPRALFKPGAIITGFDRRPNEFLFLSEAFDYAWLRNLDLRALRCFERFLLEQRPDVVHFHHFLSFGLELFLIARRTLPRAVLLLTLHEFLAICRADGHMVRTFDGALCTHASPVRCHQCFPEIAPETFSLREGWIRQGLDVFDGFVAPTRFVHDRYVAWGLEARKIHVVANAERNYAEPVRDPLLERSARFRAPHNRFAFFGQLVDAKGLLVVFEALEIFATRYHEEIVFEINGTNINFASGEFRHRYEDITTGKHNLPKNIRIVSNGSYATEDLASRMRRIDWVVIPSTWWETFGLVLSEAFMFHRPPIASRIGALAERIRADEDGLLFEVRDADALADIFHRAVTEEGLWERLSAASPGVEPIERTVAAHVALFAATLHGEGSGAVGERALG